jgi:hypothetical protein
MTEIDSFIGRHWLQWSADRDYLRVGQPYRTDCPPMWFIGGRHISPGGAPAGRPISRAPCGRSLPAPNRVRDAWT